MTRNDFILIAALIIFSLMPLINFGSEKKFAVIKIGGEVVQEINLSEEKTFTIETDEGKNILEIKNGAIGVIEADCPDKICVRRGAIKNLGEVIACVPHKVLIEIAGD